MADMRTRVALVVLAVAGGTLFAGAFVASGGNSPGTPGGDLSFYGTLTDKTTGETFQVSLNANEDPNQAGVGGMFFQLNGPNISACDAHGEGAQSGSTPLATMQCGGSGNISVAVDGCGATLETHGITHAAPVVGPDGKSAAALNDRGEGTRPARAERTPPEEAAA